MSFSLQGPYNKTERKVWKACGCSVEANVSGFLWGVRDEDGDRERRQTFNSDFFIKFPVLIKCSKLQSVEDFSTKWRTVFEMKLLPSTYQMMCVGRGGLVGYGKREEKDKNFLYNITQGLCAGGEARLSPYHFMCIRACSWLHTCVSKCTCVDALIMGKCCSLKWGLPMTDYSHYIGDYYSGIKTVIL